MLNVPPEPHKNSCPSEVQQQESRRVTVETCSCLPVLAACAKLNQSQESAQSCMHVRQHAHHTTHRPAQQRVVAPMNSWRQRCLTGQQPRLSMVGSSSDQWQHVHQNASYPFMLSDMPVPTHPQQQARAQQECQSLMTHPSPASLRLEPQLQV